ncbi:hypothetical protein ACFL55_01815 [Candidatus Latescibacterota bacterium]
MATNLTIGERTFVCVLLDEADFSDAAAVYVILCVKKEGNTTVLDVGQSGQVGSRIDSHDRKTCWDQKCSSNNIWVCVHKMPSSNYTKQDREEFESHLRDKYNPPCGSK